MRKAAKDLDMNREDVRRSVKVALLSEEAQEAAVELDLDNNRRHLSVSQRGLIGAQLKSLYVKEAKERQGHGQTAPGKTLVEKLPEALGRARDQAGAAVGVSGKTIDAAVTVKEQGIPPKKQPHKIDSKPRKSFPRLTACETDETAATCAFCTKYSE